MKRFSKLLAIAAMLVMLMVPGAWAAGEVVTLDDSGGRFYDNHGNWTMYVITITVLGDATNGSIADTPIYSDNHASGPSTGIVHGGPVGWCLDEVSVDPGATAPDEAKVQIKNSGDEDLLNGNGATLIHATLTQSTHPSCDGQPKRRPITGTITLDVDDQATAAAIYVVTLKFVRPN